MKEWIFEASDPLEERILNFRLELDRVYLEACSNQNIQLGETYLENPDTESRIRDLLRVGVSSQEIADIISRTLGQDLV